MRLIVLAAVVSTGYAVSGNYLQINWTDIAVANITTDSQDACSPATISSTLLRTVDVVWHANDAKTYVNDLQGACLNFKMGGDTFVLKPISAFPSTWATPYDASAAFFKTSTAGEYEIKVSVGSGCVNLVAPVTIASGFSGLASATDCGGSLTAGAAADVSSGLDFNFPSAPKGVGAEGTLFSGKKMLAMDISGPYTITGCTTLSSGNTRLSGNIPIVVPLEDAVANPTTNNITGLSATNVVMTNFSEVNTVNQQFMVATSTGANAGEIKIHVTWGAGAVQTNGYTMTASTTEANNYVMTYAVGVRGNITSTCLQGFNTAATPVANGGWFKIIPHRDTMGTFPEINEVAFPTSCPSGPPVLLLPQLRSIYLQQWRPSILLSH